MLKIAFTCFSTVDVERNTALSIAAFVLPALVGVLREHHDPGFGVEQLGRVARARDHVDLARVLEQPSHALAHEVVVLGDHDAQHLGLIRRGDLPTRAG